MEKTGDNDGLGTFIVVEYACSDISQSDKSQMGVSCPDGQSIFVRYAHLQENSNAGLSVGKEIDAGQGLGKVGDTGNSDGNHTHLETCIGKSGSYSSYGQIGPDFIDPLLIFPLMCTAS